MKRSPIRRVLREPVAQFLLIGLALLGADTLRGRGSPAQSTPTAGASVIEITQAQLDATRQAFAARAGRLPSDDETRELLDEFVMTEVLYREAMRYGLQQDDQVVRRWLAQRMRFVLQDVEAVEAPDPAAVAARAITEPAPVRVAVSHMFFEHRADAEDAARRLLAGTAAPRAGEPLPAGEPFAAGNHLPAYTQTQLAGMFGRDFAAHVVRLDPQTWSAPIASTFGWHLVWPSRGADVAGQDLDQLRTRMLREARAAANDEALDRARARYTVRYPEQAL